MFGLVWNCWNWLLLSALARYEKSARSYPMYLSAPEFDDLKDLFQVKHHPIATHIFIFHFSLLSKTLHAFPFSIVHILDYGDFKSKIYIVHLKEENPVK